ncbi:Crp/Fnr family transcriptional regulator [Taibaiella soli]|uniref:Crp/Fnr family transcriptional regulator n=1 Tax=Taibaiella soli TaxID=1649169 RepID=A0A2W2ABU5_9BACT|nr:Crp/Fnr family transcriptional regulator [Taibaiella soli]PZF72761.1 Crp/Fnr family transcriptional regulator [Taibaiella soli]
MSIQGLFPIDKWDFKSESVLQDLPPEDLKLLLAHKSEDAYKKGEVIFREGAYPTGIFYITEGKVKKYKVDKDGKEQILYVANKGEIIGYHAILSEDRYPDAAAALEASVITFIPREDFLAAIQNSPVLSKRLLKTLSHEFTVLTNSLSALGQKTVRQRLALHLIVLREKYKVDFQPGDPVVINMRREDLAGIVGTARENVIRILKEFKEEEILQTKGAQIIIYDIGKLIAIADWK